MQSPLFIVSDESDTDGAWGTIIRLFVLPLSRYCRLRQGQDICARHGLSELMNGREMRGEIHLDTADAADWTGDNLALIYKQRT